MPWADSEPEVVLSVAELLELARENLRDGLGEVVVEGGVDGARGGGHSRFEVVDPVQEVLPAPFGGGDGVRRGVGRCHRGAGRCGG